ncbi:MAG: thiamine-phosphate kinase [Burkholderiales bacterium]|nr:thiamine-phosphate kinase [Burkholderiales bacterium]
MLSEFDVIARYFTQSGSHTVLGVGDDAALLQPTHGMTLAVSTDMLVAGRHFFADADPRQLGHKVLAVNLSDMAAMGARPRWATLAVALPEINEGWLAEFAGGFMALARRYDVDLVGGDTTQGPTNLCAQIIGEVPRGRALRRDGAKVGDQIWVSGQLGDAALALAHLQNRISLERKEIEACLPALHTPQPRVALGLALIAVASSAIDVSDGLVADLGHILERSEVGAAIDFAAIPKSAFLARHAANPVACAASIAGGDDYELCFTAPLSEDARIRQIAGELGLPLTRIGQIEAGNKLIVRDETGKAMNVESHGYDHFA